MNDFVEELNEHLKNHSVAFALWIHRYVVENRRYVFDSDWYEHKEWIYGDYYFSTDELYDYWINRKK